MNTHSAGDFVQGFTANQYGATATGRATNAWQTSGWTRSIATVAQRQTDAADSNATAWLMIGTIISCMAVMMAVVIATALSVS